MTNPSFHPHDLLANVGCLGTPSQMMMLAYLQTLLSVIHIPRACLCVLSRSVFHQETTEVWKDICVTFVDERPLCTSLLAVPSSPDTLSSSHHRPLLQPVLPGHKSVHLNYLCGGFRQQHIVWAKHGHSDGNRM